MKGEPDFAEIKGKHIGLVNRITPFPQFLPEPCDRIPVSLFVLVPADKASEFVRSIIQTSSTSGPKSLCMVFNKLEFEKRETSGPSPAETYVSVAMDLDVLDFPDSLREEKRPEAPKP